MPGLGRATGNTVLVDVGAGQKEWIMAGIVVLAIVFAVAAQLLFRAQEATSQNETTLESQPRTLSLAILSNSAGS